jgi:hypothetical protein
MLDENESSFITDQIQLLTIAPEVAADKTFETAFTVESRA